MDGRGGHEFNAETAVVAAGAAWFALEAGDVGFDGDSVADFERGDG